MKSLLIILATLCLISCKKQPQPAISYELTTINYIPDSLKQKQQLWITETVRAASQHLSAGDYEDVHKTIYAAGNESEDLFGIKVIGLRKIYGQDGFYDSVEIVPDNMTKYEKQIFNKLLTANDNLQ